MTSWEYTLVLGTIAIGIVPGLLSYHFINANNSMNAFLGEDQQQNYVASVVIPVKKKDTNVVADMYQSRPKKEVNGSCSNSNYSSFTMVLAEDNTFLLSKRCESTKDSSLDWHGTVSEEENLILSVLGDKENDYEEPLEIIFTRNENELIVATSSVKELPTTTSFASILN